MAYPFGGLLKFSELISRLADDHKIELKTLDGHLIPPDGEALAVHYLEGDMDGKSIRCSIVIDDFDAYVLPSQIRSLCARFGIDPKPYGLPLG